MLDDIKLLLGIDDDSRDDLLNLLIRNAEKQVMGCLQELDFIPKDVPEPLAYIVTELVVARYNRIGSEGMSAHTVEGESVSYTTDDLALYEQAIERYLDTLRKPKAGVLRFL